jgi:AraC-like DNA-binding protein
MEHTACDGKNITFVCGFNKVAMNNIPVHKMQERDLSGVMVSRVLNDIQLSSVNHVHRHNYYLFFLQEKGENSCFIDFKEYKAQNAAIACILPGQVHYAIATQKEFLGWVLEIDALFVKNEWKNIFDRVLFLGNIVVLDDETMHDLKSCIVLLHKKIQPDNQQLQQDIVVSLATSFVGMLAEIYQNKQPVAVNRQSETITLRFKSLFHEHLYSRKKPSQYASLLHLSPSYLNEAVKNTTGFTAGYWIRHEIVLEAKRLLFYTNMSVKEIAFKLGYEDCAYFTRLFTRTAGISPVRFKKNYRK